MITKANVPENLRRRNMNDFVDDLSPVDFGEFKKAVKHQIHHLERAKSLNPDNSEIIELYEYTKNLID
jgi:hypothetical protein